MQWCVYGLICRRGTEEITYIGCTNDWNKRLELHFQGKACKFTKSFPVESGRVLIKCRDRSEAQVYEARVKKMSPEDKLNWIKGDNSVEIRA